MKSKALVIICALAISLGIFVAVKMRPSTNPLANAIGGPFTMTNHQGVLQSTEDFDGKIQLIYFGYTYCPDACPMALGQMTRVMQSLEEGRQSQIQPIFVSVDGERDTPEHLREYIKPFDSRFVAFTGNSSEAERLFHVYSKKIDLKRDDGFYLVDHTTSIFVLDQNGHYVTRIRHDQSAQELFDAIRPLLD